jgi:hypothetical protein
LITRHPSPLLGLLMLNGDRITNFPTRKNIKTVVL